MVNLFQLELYLRRITVQIEIVQFVSFTKKVVIKKRGIEIAFATFDYGL